MINHPSINVMDSSPLGNDMVFDMLECTVGMESDAFNKSGATRAASASLTSGRLNESSSAPWCGGSATLGPDSAPHQNNKPMMMASTTTTPTVPDFTSSDHNNHHHIIFNSNGSCDGGSHDEMNTCAWPTRSTTTTDDYDGFNVLKASSARGYSVVVDPPPAPPKFLFHIKVGVEVVAPSGHLSPPPSLGGGDTHTYRSALHQYIHHNLSSPKAPIHVDDKSDTTTRNAKGNSKDIIINTQADIITDYLIAFHTPELLSSLRMVPPKSPPSPSSLMNSPSHALCTSLSYDGDGTCPLVHGDFEEDIGGDNRPSPRMFGDALGAFRAFDKAASMMMSFEQAAAAGGGSTSSSQQQQHTHISLSPRHGGGGSGVCGGWTAFSAPQDQFECSQTSLSSAMIPTPINTKCVGVRAPASPNKWGAFGSNIRNNTNNNNDSTTSSAAFNSRSRHHSYSVGGAGGGGVGGVWASRARMMSLGQGGTSIGSLLGDGDVGVVSELKAGEEMDTGFDMINEYIVWDQISSGSQGATFEVIDTRGGGKRCMKVVRRDLILHRTAALSTSTDTDPENERRMSMALGLKLHREVAIMKRLRHPNIVRLYEVIDDPTVNSVYMFMDLVNGGPLCKELGHPTSTSTSHPHGDSFSTSLDKSNGAMATYSADIPTTPRHPHHHHRPSIQHRVSLCPSTFSDKKSNAAPQSAPPLSRIRFEPIPFDKLVRFAHQIAGGLRYLHRHGIVHRDIKPDNILIDKHTNKAVIVDFGVSEADTSYADPMVIAGGAVTGTPAFVAPELWSDDGGSVSGVAADVWSLGVTLFVATVGFLPFVGGSTPELRQSIISSPPQQFPTKWWLKSSPTATTNAVDVHLYAQWESIVMGLLNKDLSKRSTLPDFLSNPFFAAVGVTTSSPSPLAPPSTKIMPHPPPDDDIVRQGSPSRWARFHQSGGDGSSGCEEEESVPSVEEPIPPSGDELTHAVEGVRTHRRLSLIGTVGASQQHHLQKPRGSVVQDVGRKLPKSRRNLNVPS